MAPGRRLVPVSEAFLPFWGKTDPIILYYGSYGSGKSFFCADDLINKCITADYFRCYYGRKVFRSVRDTVFQTIIEEIKRLNLQHLFSFSEAENSSMIIKHRETGNSFTPFGADNPDTLKSIKEPTHFFLEEMDQFKASDFALIYSRLGRTSKSYTQFIGCFNTEKVDKDHYIRKTFFSGDSVEALKMHSTYLQNDFIDREGYETKLRISAMGSQKRYEAIALGAWGEMINDSPWFYAFDEKRHIAMQPLKYDPTAILYLSFDFNINPATCTVGQGVPGVYWHYLKSYKIANCTLKELCRRIASDYPGAVFRVTGDPAGRARSTGYNAANETMYTIIQRELNLSYKQVDTPLLKFTGDESWRELRIFNNAILQNHPNILLCPEGCKDLINDLILARCEDGKDKLYKTSGDSQYGMHLVDGFIYMNTTYFNQFFKRTI